MALTDLTEFLKLSSVLNYNLSAASINRYNLLQFILGNRSLHRSERLDRERKSIVMEAFSLLFDAYSSKRRRLGPMAVIHPIRAAALLSRARNRLHLSQILSVLFHDILEDIKPVDFDHVRWRSLETRLNDIFERLGEEQEEILIGNLTALTKVPGETYYEYIGRLLRNPDRADIPVQVKLADRLDNTLDMWIELEDPLEGIDFFEVIFQTLFVGNYAGIDPKALRQSTSVLNGSRRLYQLFKNAVLLSLIRQKGTCIRIDDCRVLFDALCTASLREAQRTLVSQMGHHLSDIRRLRRLFLEVMDYGQSGRIDLVTRPGESFMLDGLFSGYFAPIDRQALERQLDRLFLDKPLMAEASLAFVTVFLSFLNDDRFYVQGISAEGIEARPFGEE
jgi:hypothetical protein